MNDTLLPNQAKPPLHSFVPGLGYASAPKGDALIQTLPEKISKEMVERTWSVMGRLYGTLIVNHFVNLLSLQTTVCAIDSKNNIFIKIKRKY